MTPAKRTTAAKSTAKKSTAKKAATKKAVAKKTTTTKTVAKRTAAKRAPAKAPASKAKGGALLEGAKAPAFSLLDQNAKKVSLSSLSGRKVLVYFYPKADTPGCTAQSCGLRDVAKQVGRTAIVGISPDQPEKLARFDDKYSLGFTLLSDPDHSVADAYGVWGEKSLYGKKYMGIVRSAFLIDEKGKVEHAWYKVSPKDTPANLLKALGK